MVKRAIKNSWLLRGFTLIELMVVVGVIGILVVLTFNANRSFVYGQAVSKGQLDFLTALRTLKTAVNSGSKGDPYQILRITPTGNTYEIWTNYDPTNAPLYFRDRSTVKLPGNVVFPSAIRNTYICVVNPNFNKSFGGAFPCGSCVGSNFYACTNNTQVTGILTVTFNHSLNSSYTSDVVVEGSGNVINRMYAK